MRAEGAVIDDRSGIQGVRDLLRQLTTGLAVHRLYPSDPTASSFIAACERIVAAAQAALSAGAVRIEVRSGRFHTSDGPIEDEATRRLAQACFERRVEYLEFTSPPTRRDLATWYELLTRDAAQIEQADGMPVLLRAAGVRSIMVAAGVPEPSTGDQTSEHLPGLADWVCAADQAPTPEEVEALTLLAGEDGASLYGRLLDFSRTVPADGTIRSTFFQRAARLVEQLPSADQAVFGRLIIDGLATEPFAERYAGHLTDLALATAILTVSEHERRDPGQLARDVGISARRHSTLTRLVDTLRDQPVTHADHPGTVPAAPAVAASAGVAEGTDAGAVRDGDLIAGFPDDPIAGRRLALTALVDVLVSAPREEQVAALAANVAEHLRQGVRDGDVGAIEDLTTVITTIERLAPEAVTATAGPHVSLDAPSSVSQALVRARDEALSAELIHDAAVAAARGGQRLAPGLLTPFGSSAIASLLGAISAAGGSPVAAQLVALISAVSGVDRSALYEHLGRQRPEVLERVLPVLAQQPDEQLVSVLDRLARGSQEQVHGAVVRALEGASPALAAGVAATVIEHSALPDLRRRCLAIIEAAGAAGTPHLERLAAASGTRLPWRSRRRVRRLLRQAGRT